MTHDIEQNAPALSPTRRTVLTGAAWTLPVIAAATITPMAAASNAPVLTFDKSTYNGTACGTITGAYVTVTVNSVPTAGKSVTTTLSGGYKFSDGTTTNTQVSGSNGRVNLPAINVPSTGGNGTGSASSTGATTSTANLSAPVAGKAYSFSAQTSQSYGFSSVSSTATPLGTWGMFLDGNTLSFMGNIIATGVTKATGFDTTHDGSSYFKAATYISNGTAYSWSSEGNQSNAFAFSAVPSSATPLDTWSMFLDGNNLWYKNNIIATGVTKAAGFDTTDGTYFFNAATYIASSC